MNKLTYRLSKPARYAALVLFAGGIAALALTACGSAAAAPAATHAASSAPASVNYGQQYLNDIGPANTAAGAIASTDTLSSPDIITLGTAVATTARELLAQSWPANAQSDVHALALAAEKVNADIKQDLGSFASDAEALSAQAQVLRADLSLPESSAPVAVPQLKPAAKPVPAPAKTVYVAPPAPAAPALTACGLGMSGEEVYAGPDTSCPFALNVEQAYVQGGYWYQAGASEFDAYSPVTGSTYLMTSSSTGDPVVVQGGNNALVEFSL